MPARGRLVSLRRPVELVAVLLLSLLRHAQRLLPQAVAVRVLASLPVVLHVGSVRAMQL
jgi:hypothetical protein